MTYTAEEIEKLLAAGALMRIGMGSRRACYRLPDGKHCLKCYRSDAEIEEGKYPGTTVVKPLAAGATREIRHCRFDERRNTCCQEYRYWLELKKRLPADMMAIFPATMEQVYLPSRGWALVEELVLNADGSMPKKIAEEWSLSGPRQRDAILAAFNAIRSEICDKALCFYDPQTIIMQRCADGLLKLRITDFEPVSRAFLPLDKVKIFAKLKAKRRFARFLRVLESVPPAVDKTNQDLPRVNVLCLKWGTYYGPEYVNRLYAGVRRNLKRPFRFVCVTDNPAGLRPEVEAVPFPDDPGVIGRPWPNIFVKLCLFKNGFADLYGPTLFLDVDVCITGSLDKFFDYRPGDFCIIHNWVERRKSLFRAIPDIGNSSCFRFDAGASGAVYETFLSMKDSPEERWRFTKGSQKFQTYAMMKSGHVSWWPSRWVCSFKRHCIPLFPLNKIFTPWRPSKHSAVVAFHGHPDMVQALRGYYLKANGVPVSVHLTCKPCSWIEDYWHE